MKNLVQKIAILVLMFAASGKTFAADIDVYITFMGADKSIKDSIRNALPDNLKVKYYNASALLMADYSGKQKVIAKMSKAKLIVVVKHQTLDVLATPSMQNYVVVDGDDIDSIEEIKSLL